MIIFEGTELMLHYYKGESDYIIISFDSAPENPRGNYFLRPVVEKYNISCLGITVKTYSYYQHSDMNKIIELCNDISKDYNKIIIIGLSIAGYGALKFSKALNADIVFAMAPRCTIDFNLYPITTQSQKFAERLPETQIKESTIQKMDVQGKIYLIYDKQFPAPDSLDYIHFNHLHKIIPNAIYVPVFYTDHVVIHHLQGSTVFKSIIDALVTENDQKVIQTVSYVRRHHIKNVIFKAYHALEKLPLLTYKMMISTTFKNVKNNYTLLEDYQFRLKLCYQLNIKGYQQESSDYLKDSFFYHTQNIPNNDLQQIEMLNPYPYLINYNGYYLAYNFVTQQLEAILHISEKPYTLPLQLYKKNGKIKLVCIYNGVIFELQYGDKSSYNLAMLSNECINKQVKLKFANYRIFIQKNNSKNYINITPDKKVFSSKNLEAWESFTAISMVSFTNALNERDIFFNFQNHKFTINISML